MIKLEQKNYTKTYYSFMLKYNVMGRTLIESNELVITLKIHTNQCLF